MYISVRHPGLQDAITAVIIANERQQSQTILIFIKINTHPPISAIDTKTNSAMLFRHSPNATGMTILISSIHVHLPMLDMYS